MIAFDMLPRGLMDLAGNAFDGGVLMAGLLMRFGCGAVSGAQRGIPGRSDAGIASEGSQQGEFEATLSAAALMDSDTESLSDGSGGG